MSLMKKPGRNLNRRDFLKSSKILVTSSRARVSSSHSRLQPFGLALSGRGRECELLT